MGVRVGARSSLTVACAFVGGHLRDLDAYLAARARTAENVRAAATAAVGVEPAVEVNTADDPAAGSVYLTVTGTSAEAEPPARVAELTPRAKEITRHHLAEIGSLWELLLQRNLATDGLVSL